jgi:hypothetical protein
MILNNIVFDRLLTVPPVPPATRQDDSPLYIFDGTFADASRGSAPMGGHYAVPPLFSEDLFHLAGEKRRPPYRCVGAGRRLPL